MVLTLFVWISSSPAAGNLLPSLDDPDFFASWRHEPGEMQAGIEERVGEPALVLRVADDVDTGWYRIVHETAAREGEAFELTGWSRGVNLRGGAGAFLTLEFAGPDGRRIAHVPAFLYPGAPDWAPLRSRAVAPEGAETVRAAAGINGRGEAQLRALTLRPRGIPEPTDAERVTLQVTDERAVDAIHGFGAEDDGWFYNPHNRERGVDDEAIRIREERIRWMAPDWVRMFFWYDDWNPSLDGETFTWDSANMESHYRTLDLYEELGAKVNVVGVEWALDMPWEDHERMARMVGSLLEHLIVERGYTCVQEWTLTNEPNLFFARQGGRWEDFVAIHQHVAAELDRRGLDVAITGSDDGDGFSWFHQCAADPGYAAHTSLYASHFYLKPEELAFAGDLFADRLDALAEHDPGKPFVITEYGLQDERTQPPSKNPYMEDYEYALLSHAFYIDALNAGVAGINIWCLHEVYYPGGERPMNSGLWNFGDRDWSVRPIYHSVASFTRHANPGDPACRTESTDPARLRGVRIGDTLYWANVGNEAVTVALDGFEADTVRIMTKDTIDGDRETGQVKDIGEDMSFHAPPRSFGYAHGSGGRP